jgi:hypothetical protein
MSSDTLSGPAAVDRPPKRAGRRPSAYLLLSAAALLASALVSYRQPWIGDFGLHAAVVGRLRDSLSDPADPMVRAYAPSPYFTPYPLLLALVARVTGASAAVVLSAAGPVNLALLLYGLRRFVGLFTPSRRAALLALCFVPLLWGPAALEWSGFPTLRGLALILPYPSTVGFGLMLLVWVLVARASADNRPWRWAAAGLLGGVLILVHPFTALCAALGALAFVLGRPVATPGGPADPGTASTDPAVTGPAGTPLSRPGLAGMLLGAVTAGVVVLAWPYFRITEVLGATAELHEIHRRLYADPLANYGLAFAVGLPALFLRLRRTYRDPLVLLFALAGLVVLAGWLTGAYAFGRVWPVVILSLQVAAAVELAALAGVRFGVTGRDRPGPGPTVTGRILAGAWLTGTALACLAGLAVQYGNLLLVLPPGQLTSARRTAHRVTYPPGHAWVGKVVGRDQLVLTGDVNAARLLLRYEVRAVAPPWPDPLLPDEARRRADQAELLDPATAEPRRRELLGRYGVDWILDVRGGYDWADPYAVEIVPGPGPARLLRIR